MFSDHLSKIDGIAVFPIISMILFISLFVIAIIWVVRLDKKYLHRMENLPLDSNSENKNNSEINNEIQE
jgi:hypothetical protein